MATAQPTTVNAPTSAPVANAPGSAQELDPK